MIGRTRAETKAQYCGSSGKQRTEKGGDRGQTGGPSELLVKFQGGTLQLQGTARSVDWQANQKIGPPGDKLN